MFITSILVCLSTVLVKQHVFVDVISEIMVVEVGYLFPRLLEKLFLVNLFS